MRAHPVTQILRVVWLAVPFVMSGPIGEALADRSRPVQLTATIGAWAGWAVIMIATLTVLPVALTALRLLVPLGPLAVVLVAVTDDAPGPLTAVAGVLAAVAAVLACTGWVADDFVDGASYGDERRCSLRAPAALLLGPIPLAVALTDAAVVAGPLLLAARQWAWGALVSLAGIGVVITAARSMHSLSTRALVFVPAGITLVDPLTTVEPVPMPRQRLAAFGPATAGSDALDLSGGALGLALELTMRTPIDLTRRTGRRSGEDVSATGIICTPARPGTVLDEARQRAIPPPSTRSPS